jgi:hypothetical protein
MENIISMSNLPATIRAAMDIQTSRVDGYPLLILGPVGVGKSQVPVQVAQEEGWEVITVNLCNYQPSEVTGWVTQVGDVMSQLLPDWAQRVFDAAKAGKKTIIIFEEFPQCDIDVQKAAAQVNWDRRVAGFRLPENCLIIANGNRKADKAAVKSIPEHQVSRFTILTLEAELDPTLAHFAKIGVAPEVTTYLTQFPDGLHRHVADGTPFPCPRTWVAVSDVVKGGFPKAVETPLIAGAIGVGEQAKFTGFLRIWRDLVAPSKVFADPLGSPVPDAADVRYAMVGSLVAAASSKTAKALATYIKRLPAEYHSVAAAAIKRRNDTASDPSKKISAKEFTDILIETAQLLNEEG